MEQYLKWAEFIKFLICNPEFVEKRLFSSCEWETTTQKKEMLKNFYLAITTDVAETKIFVLQDKDLITLINMNKRPKMDNLPYDNFFIDVELKIGEIIFSGIIVKKDCYGTTLRCLARLKNSTILVNSSLDDFFLESSYVSDWEKLSIIESYEKQKEFIPRAAEQEIKNFAMNFILFLNEPDVDIVSVERTEGQNQKRIKRGQFPIPTLNYVTVSGELKIYLDRLKSLGCFKYSHKFWVRGHWRVLRNEERFKNKIGTRIWIKPFIKGQGVLVEKRYDVKQNKQHRLL